MAAGVVSGIQSVACSLPGTGLLAEPRESHVCGIPAWSTQGECVGVTGLFFLLGASRC